MDKQRQKKFSTNKPSLRELLKFIALLGRKKLNSEGSRVIQVETLVNISINLGVITIKHF